MISSEKPSLQGNDHKNQRQSLVNQSHLTKTSASPSNGQCPTAVSTIHSFAGPREMQQQSKQRQRPRNTKTAVTKLQTGKNHEEQKGMQMALEIKQEVMAQRKKVGSGTTKNSESQKISDLWLKTTNVEADGQQEDASSFCDSQSKKLKEGRSEEVSDQAKQLLKEKKFRVKNSENSKREQYQIDETQKRTLVLMMKQRNDNSTDQDQGSETTGYNLKMQNIADGVSGSQKLTEQKVSGSPIVIRPPSSNQLQKNNAVIEFNNSQSPQDPLMTSSRSKNNQSPTQEESIGMPIQITNQLKQKRHPSLNLPDQPGASISGEELQQNMKGGGSTPSVQEYQKLKQLQQVQQQETLQNYQDQIGCSMNNPGYQQRDESPQFDGGSRDGAPNANNHLVRNQQQRLSQPDRINTQASHQTAGPGTSAGTKNQTQSKRPSPTQNARSFIIRNTTQQNNYSVPTQQGVNQPKVLPPVSRAQVISKKGKTPIINGSANQSFQLNSRVTGATSGPKKASPIDGNRDGQIRRLSQNQNSINTYLEQESRFDSTKDASDLGGFGGPGTSSLVKDYNSSLPDSIKMKGSGGYHDQRSYDEAWQVDQGSQNSCQHGEVSCEPQPRLVSAQTSLLNKRRPSGNRLNQDFFEGLVENDQPTLGNSKKQMKQLTQPRTKDFTRKAQHMRGTLQSQNQNRFVDEMVDDDDEYCASAQIAMHHDGNKAQKVGQNNYNSPVQLREMGHSQQMVPNQMKQQLKQRRTVYGQSFFNSPPYPTGSQHFGMQHQPDTDGPAGDKTRSTQLDSSLRRKRQLPVPTSSNQAQQQVVAVQSKPKKHQHHRLMSGSNAIHQQQPPQSQQRKTLQKHIESTAQHLEFDERQTNEGKISQLSRFNVCQAGMRNVLTAGEDKRVVDHFPVSRASRWKQQNQGLNNAAQYQHQVNGNVYDHMMHMEGYDGGAGQDHMPGVGRHHQAQIMQIQPLQEPTNERKVSGGAKQRGGGSRGLGQQQQTHLMATQQQIQQNTKKLPKRSGTASYITQGGVRITINKDNKHLNGANLTTETEENMNLMFYDFNNTKAQEVIPEETQRNLLRSQTTDRGPSRKLRSRGRFKLASSNQQKRGEDDAGLGEIQPFGVSTEFEMGMYPPGSSHLVDEDPTEDSRHIMQHEAAYGKPETMHSSPHNKDFSADADGAEAAYKKNNSKASGHRNIQGKRLSSQTIIQRQSQKPGQGIHGNTMISSHQPYVQEQSASPSHASKQGSNALAQSAGQRRVQKQYRAADGTTAARQHTQGVIINSSEANHNRASMPGPNTGKMNKGNPYNHQPRNDLFRSSNNPKNHHAGEPLQNMQNQHQHAQQPKSQSSQKNHNHNPQSRLPQHRQTNLANVMESIREEDPHL